MYGKIKERLAHTWLNREWSMRVYQILGIILLGAVGFLLVLDQQDSNADADRERDRIASIQRTYDSDIRAWENDLDSYEQCLMRVDENDALREDLLGLNQMLRDVIQVIEDANPTTEAFGPLFDVVAANRSTIETNHASFPPDYCPAAPPPEPVRPTELT